MAKIMHVAVYLEPRLYDALIVESQLSGESMSAIVRSLIIKHLDEKGRLPKDLLMALATSAK